MELKEPTERRFKKKQYKQKAKTLNRQKSSTDLQEHERIKFTELPAEIRNNIYSELLVLHRPIVIKRFQNGRTKRSPQQTRNMSERSYKVRAFLESDGGFRYLGRTYLRNQNPLAILVANKSINEESRRIFYGANTFIFLNAQALSEFKARTGSNFTLLQDLKIIDVRAACAPELRKSLFALAAPTRLELSVSEYVGANRPRDIATWLWVIAKRFIENRGEWLNNDNGSDEDVEDVEHEAAKGFDKSDEVDLYKGGFYASVPIVNVKKQKKRFNTICFGYTPRLLLKLQDGQHEDRDDWREVTEWGVGHDLVKAEVLECWENENRPIATPKPMKMTGRGKKRKIKRIEDGDDSDAL